MLHKQRLCDVQRYNERKNKVKTRGADQLLKVIADRLLAYLNDLKDCRDAKLTPFECGEKLAYTECLEMLQFYEKAKDIGLDFNIEERFPL